MEVAIGMRPDCFMKAILSNELGALSEFSWGRQSLSGFTALWFSKPLGFSIADGPLVSMILVVEASTVFST